MWTQQLALLTLVTALAPLATPAPAPALIGAPNLRQQFSAFNPYGPQSYGQQAYIYPYTTTATTGGQYGTGYYGGTASYYDPNAYNYAANDVQTTHEPLKIASSKNGKYDSKKSDNGYYDAKLYNSGKHNPRNYDSGHYDHEKYGTKPVHNVKKTPGHGSGKYNADSEGAETRQGSTKPGSLGFFIRGDGSGGFNWGQFGQYGYSTTDQSVTSQNIGAHNVKHAPSQKDALGNGFNFDKKDVFAKIDVFGPNHEQLFTGGRQVFADAQNGHIDRFDIQPSNPAPATAVAPSGNGIDSYGFYLDASNLYSDRPFDGGSSADGSFVQQQSGNRFSQNVRQSASHPSPLTHGPAGVAGGVVGSFDRQPARDAAGSGGDSYGYYSDPSNLYGTQPWVPLDTDSVAVQAVTQQPKNIDDVLTQPKDFDAGLTENRVDVASQQPQPVRQSSQDVSAATDSGFDTYGFYSNLDNLYRPDPAEFPIEKNPTTSNKVTPFQNQATSSDLRDFSAGLSPNRLSLTKVNNRGRPVTQFSQTAKDQRRPVPQFSQTASDKRGPVPQFSQTANVQRRPVPQFDQAADVQKRPVPQFDQAADVQRKPVTSISQNTAVDDTDFDSYGFYSNLDNLYRPDPPQELFDSASRAPQQPSAASAIHRQPVDATRGSLTRSSPTRSNPGQSSPVRQAQADPFPDRAPVSSSTRRGPADTQPQQNDEDFDSYGFYSDLRNLYRN